MGVCVRWVYVLDFMRTSDSSPNGVDFMRTLVITVSPYYGVCVRFHANIRYNYFSKSY